MTAAALLVPAVDVAAGSAPRAPARPASTPHDLVRVNFNEQTAPDGEPVKDIDTTGSATVDVAVATAGGGQLVTAPARNGTGRAVETPEFDPASDGERAVVRITNAAGTDRLDPASKNFSFGADFVLDADSAKPGSNDDGDNLLQRGLYGDEDQYKLQLDGRRPSCRLKGNAGGTTAAVQVTSTVEVDSTHWYRAECVRVGTRLDVVVKRLGGGSTVTTSTTGPAVLKVKMAAGSIPVSIGGKLNANGTVNPDSDQFNGRIDNAYVRID